MGTLLFVCPKSGQEIDSCVEMDDTSLTLTRPLSIQIWCPFCGETHEFKIEQGHRHKPLAA